jgi:hypothetical protein
MDSIDAASSRQTIRHTAGLFAPFIRQHHTGQTSGQNAQRQHRGAMADQMDGGHHRLPLSPQAAMSGLAGDEAKCPGAGFGVGELLRR